jgi:hypothetical protein
MGWIVYGNDRVTDPKAECDSICTWEREGTSGRVLASGIVGDAYYAAVEHVQQHERAAEERQVFAAVFLIQKAPFGYKSMDEGMGPCEDRAPLDVLQALEALPPVPPVTAWNECEFCGGTGKMAAPNSHIGCWNCDGAGEVPADRNQIDRNRHARDWRKRAWSHHGGEPPAHQLTLV